MTVWRDQTGTTTTDVAGSCRSEARINDSLPINTAVLVVLGAPCSSTTMLAPYPDRLRSSRSTPAQGNAASPASTATPSPPPPQTFPPTSSSSTSHHRLFPSRSNLPLSRMRTNSLSSPSPSRSDSPSSSTDFVPPTSLRNASRRPQLHTRPSTSSGVPDQKQSSVVPIVVTSPSVGSSAIPVRPLFTRGLSSLVHTLQFEAIFRLHDPHS